MLSRMIELPGDGGASDIDGMGLLTVGEEGGVDVTA